MTLKNYKTLYYGSLGVGVAVLFISGIAFRFSSLATAIAMLVLYPLDLFFPRFYRKEKFPPWLRLEALLVLAFLILAIVQNAFPTASWTTYTRMIVRIGFVVMLVMYYRNNYRDDNGHTEGKIPSPFFRKDDAISPEQ